MTGVVWIRLGWFANLAAVSSAAILFVHRACSSSNASLFFLFCSSVSSGRGLSGSMYGAGLFPLPGSSPPPSPPPPPPGPPGPPGGVGPAGADVRGGGAVDEDGWSEVVRVAVLVTVVIVACLTEGR